MIVNISCKKGKYSLNRNVGKFMVKMLYLMKINDNVCVEVRLGFTRLDNISILFV